uniref:anti-sigma factor n=1 Tax=Pararhizobium sp. IMCC3301 TaxID=3067904 RepID=UPI00274141D3|nr:anti-sigma factor [Pararhizobium sp. IMCC3301]
MSDPTEKDENAMQAAEYALRLLEGEELRAARARVLSDPVFAQQVADWQEDMAGLAETVEPVAPSRAIKPALEARLFGKERKQSLWQRAGLWQGVSFASVAVAGFLAFLLVSLPEPQTGTLYVTELAGENDSLRILAVYNDVTNEIQVTRTDGGAASGRTLELWGIAAGENPVSIGVLPETATARLVLPAGLVTALDGLTLAVSDEPPGGSPTGLPTGDVLAVGEISRI